MEQERLTSHPLKTRIVTVSVHIRDFFFFLNVLGILSYFLVRVMGQRGRLVLFRNSFTIIRGNNKDYLFCFAKMFTGFQI